MKIKDLSFQSKLFLAPLAGYSDAAFRHICHEFGSAAAVTEMVSAEGLARDSAKTENLLKRYPGEEKLIIQLFGPDKDPFQRACEKVMEYKPDMIDVNCGCPVPKVVKTGAGSALMKDPKKIKEIVSVLIEETHLPISVKFRLGWEVEKENYIEFAEAAAEGGASAFTLHARTRSQGYSGEADWSHIRKLKEHFKDSGIVIFGSGDIFSPEAAVKMLAETGADGVMFARGAIGNPFIFQETKDLINNGCYTKPSKAELKSTIIKHLDYMIEEEGERTAVKEMRKHICAYMKGIEGGNKIKVKAVEAKSREEYITALSLLG